MGRYFFVMIGIVFSITGWGQSLTQSVIASGGDYAPGRSSSLSWTIGEMVIETYSPPSLYLTQGFQQSFNGLTLSGLSTENEIQISVYPNPVWDMIHIDVQSSNATSCIKIELIDMMGKSVFDSGLMCEAFHNTIDISKYSSTLFVLRVTGNSGQVLKQCRIIKWNT